METKVILLGAVVLLLLGAVAMYGFGISFGRGFFEGFQGGSGAPAMNTFTMYYADWCPHCQTAKPEIEELVKKGYIDVGSKRCYIRMISPENEPEAAKGKKINGFPTFLLETTDGETVEYKGARNTDGYLKFINEKLGGGI
jgi:thiol-disulfide isomerase/thioredoxin